jgi:hypothetical protein
VISGLKLKTISPRSERRTRSSDKGEKIEFEKNVFFLRTTIVESLRSLRKFCPLFHSPPSPGEKTFLCSLRSLWLNSFHSWLRLCRARLFVCSVVKFLVFSLRRSRARVMWLNLAPALRKSIRSPARVRPNGASKPGDRRFASLAAAALPADEIYAPVPRRSSTV